MNRTWSTRISAHKWDMGSEVDSFPTSDSLILSSGGTCRKDLIDLLYMQSQAFLPAWLVEWFRNGDCVKWNKLSIFFYQKNSYSFQAACGMHCICSVGFLCHHNSPEPPAPLTSSYESLYFKNMDYFNQRRLQKRKLMLIFKYLGNINRPVFSRTNFPICRCERPGSC